MFANFEKFDQNTFCKNEISRDVVAYLTHSISKIGCILPVDRNAKAPITIGGVVIDLEFSAWGPC